MLLKIRTKLILMKVKRFSTNAFFRPAMQEVLVENHERRSNFTMSRS